MESEHNLHGMESKLEQNGIRTQFKWNGIQDDLEWKYGMDTELHIQIGSMRVLWPVVLLHNITSVRCSISINDSFLLDILLLA